MREVVWPHLEAPWKLSNQTSGAGIHGAYPPCHLYSRKTLQSQQEAIPTFSEVHKIPKRRTLFPELHIVFQAEGACHGKSRCTWCTFVGGTAKPCHCDNNIKHKARLTGRKQKAIALFCSRRSWPLSNSNPMPWYQSLAIENISTQQNSKATHMPSMACIHMRRRQNIF